jgi:ubiquinone/menaquinone biosynthesis C-methylase UbiE
MLEMSLLSQFAPLQTIVCCLQSRSALSLITTSELARRLPEEERHRIPAGTIGAFVSESSQTAYPIVGQIVDFLEQDSLRLSRDRPSERTGREAENASIQQSVKQWYDDFGWLRNESGIYNDTVLFSQRSLTPHGAYELASHISLLDKLSGGDFVLDAASGPIPHAENLAYSWFYKYRVCVDISLTALREAQTKLDSKGFCCMANICQLPFREGVFDGIVSAYTVQHIAESQQSEALAELYRVLKPRSHLCVISDLQQTRAHRALVLILRAIREVLRLLSIRRTRANRQQGAQVSARPKPPHQLYFHGQDLAWWRKQARGLTGSYALVGLRLFKKEEFELLFGVSMRAAKTVRALEVLFPGLAARMCAYLLVDFYKPQG